MDIRCQTDNTLTQILGYVGSTAVLVVAAGVDVFRPNRDNGIDLGASGQEWKNFYVDGTANIDNLTLTSGSVVDTIQDEDDMASDLSSALATQQSIKAYVDAVDDTRYTPAISSLFETSGRFNSTIVSGGTLTFGTTGVNVNSSSTISSAAAIRTSVGSDMGLRSIARWFCTLNGQSQGTDYNTFWGVGDLTVGASSITYTDDQYGFKSIRASSGTVAISATNANGTTETATDISETTEAGAYFIDRQSSSSIKFYVMLKNDTSYTLEATHTTNISTAADNMVFKAAVSNVGVASATSLLFNSFGYQHQVVA